MCYITYPVYTICVCPYTHHLTRNGQVISMKTLGKARDYKNRVCVFDFLHTKVCHCVDLIQVSYKLDFHLSVTSHHSYIPDGISN